MKINFVKQYYFQLNIKMQIFEELMGSMGNTVLRK